EAQIRDYATFLIKQEKGFSYKPKSKEIKTRISTIKPIVSDFDMLTIGAFDISLIQRSYQKHEELGYLTPASQKLLLNAYKISEALGIQRIIQHGAEVDNLNFPED